MQTNARSSRSLRHAAWSLGFGFLGIATAMSGDCLDSTCTRRRCGRRRRRRGHRRHSTSGEATNPDPLISPNTGSLMVRIGFGVYYTIRIIRNPQNSIGKYQGPHIKHETWDSALQQPGCSTSLSRIDWKLLETEGYLSFF